MALITKAIIQSSSLARSVFVRSFSVSALRTQARPVDSEFPILTDPLKENKQLPSFMVGTENGFLPRQVHKTNVMLQNMQELCLTNLPLGTIGCSS